MMLERTEDSSSSMQPIEIMGGTRMDSMDFLKGPADYTPPNEITYRAQKMLEHTENLLDCTPLQEVQKLMASSRHNKPKKANTLVIPQDYVCTSEDMDVIKLIMSAPKDTKFVDIGDALLTNDDLKCLTHGDMFLPDDVINAYIYCMRAHDHLRDRAGGKIYLDNTFVSAQLKRDLSEHRHIIERVYLYVKHDMVFLPINISKTHWYLVVINAIRREIQVLDSLGIGMSRNDLTFMLQGLEKHLKIASQRKGFDKGEKWQDFDVTTWPIVEHIRERLQTDGASCGLFMLNFMEYWTGDMLSDHVTQGDMKEFRSKLAVILYESELNKIRGSPIFKQSKDEEKNESDSDLTILPSPERPNSGDVGKEKCPLPVGIMSTKPDELVDVICKYIMSIDDADCLEKEWVRSSEPYPLGLTLKQIQVILMMDQSLDKDCFNMAVRILACDEIQMLIEPPVHNMDLRFCSAMIDGTRHPNWRVKPDSKALATLLHNWPGINNDISSCNMILLPHAFLGDYILFTIDKHERRVSILDPFSVPLSDERYALKFLRYSFYLNEALEIAQPGWSSDIYFWPRKYPGSIPIPTSTDRNLSGYLVFSFMLSWDGKRFVHPVCTDSYELRKKFLIHLLMYHANEVEENIPDVVQGYLRRLKGIDS